MEWNKLVSYAHTKEDGTTGFVQNYKIKLVFFQLLTDSMLHIW